MKFENIDKVLSRVKTEKISSLVSVHTIKEEVEEEASTPSHRNKIPPSYDTTLSQTKSPNQTEETFSSHEKIEPLPSQNAFIASGQEQHSATATRKNSRDDLAAPNSSTQSTSRSVKRLPVMSSMATPANGHLFDQRRLNSLFPPSFQNNKLSENLSKDFLEKARKSFTHKAADQNNFNSVNVQSKSLSEENFGRKYSFSKERKGKSPSGLKLGKDFVAIGNKGNIYRTVLNRGNKGSGSTTSKDGKSEIGQKAGTHERCHTTLS